MRLSDREIAEKILNHPNVGYAVLALMRDDVLVLQYREALTGVCNAIQDALIAKYAPVVEAAKKIVDRRRRIFDKSMLKFDPEMNALEAALAMVEEK